MLLLALAFSLAFVSCKKNLSEVTNDEQPTEKEITFNSYAEFQRLVSSDSSLVVKIKAADADKINANTSEAEFCSLVKLVSMPAVTIPKTGIVKTEADVLVTLPTINVYGAWPGINYLNWFYPASFFNSAGVPGWANQPAYIAFVYYTLRDNDPLYKKPITQTLLPDFKFDDRGGLFKIGYEKVNDNQIKVNLGITTADAWINPTRLGERLTPTAEGQVSFLLNKGAGGAFTGATFTTGTGSFALNAGGSSIKINSSNFSFTLNPQGQLSNVQFKTGMGNYTIWAGGSALTNTVNVGFSSTITKTFTTTFQGGYNNGQISAGFATTYGPLSGQINFAPNFDAGIQLKIKF